MASKRCLPTRFFKDADIMNVSKEGQLILVGLVLLADDEGRELAHPRLLSREIDYPPEQIEAALQELVENDLVLLYQAGKHRYYSLTRWNQWQSLSSQKITLSKYPAPPEHADVAQFSEGVSQQGEHAVESSQHFPIFPREIPGNAEEYREIPPQDNVIESNGMQEKRIEEEDEREGQPPPNVVTFPSARDDANASSYPSEQILETTKQVAAILKLSSSDALVRVVGDYIHDPGISLFGEADAAREWIEDLERNRRQQRLTPAFFRRWLKREQESSRRSLTRSLSPPGRSASLPAAGQQVANGAGPPGYNAADDPYHLYVEQRARALLLRTKEDGYGQTS